MANAIGCKSEIRDYRPAIHAKSANKEGRRRIYFDRLPVFWHSDSLRRKTVRGLAYKGEINLLRRTLAIMLVGALILTLSGFRPIHAKEGEDAQFAEKARTSVAKVGVGKEARVEVRLRDNTKVKGYVSRAEEDSFTVMDSKTGVSRTLAYSDVTKVSKQGNGFSTMTKVLIGAAVVVGAIVVWQVVKPALCDGGAQTRGPC